MIEAIRRRRAADPENRTAELYADVEKANPQHDRAYRVERA